MSYCPNCGAEHAVGDLFCARCGQLLSPSPPSESAEAGQQQETPVPPQGAAPVQPRRPSRRWIVLPLLAAVLVGALVGVLVGYVAHFVPQSIERHLRADGHRTTNLSTSRVAAAAASSAAKNAPSDDGLTSFVSSCGKVLDVVPTRAASSGAALEVTLEFRPVCPTGEMVASRAFRLDIIDTTGAPLAVGSFDFSTHKLFVPGFGDPTTTVTAHFGPGTAWAAPETLTGEITDGVVRVSCRAADGAKGAPAVKDRTAGAEKTAARTEATATSVTNPEETQRTALEALERQAADDDPSVSELEGSWIPQLSSKTDGTYDPLDRKTYRYADIYAQYLELRLKYPNVRLLSSGDWKSYEKPGYWVVIAGTPYTTPDEPNSWCDERGIPGTQCFAKQLVRDGSPEGTIRRRR